MDNKKNSMIKFINKYYKLNRSPVSKDSNTLIGDICNELDVEVKSVKSGSSCLTWVIPYSWDVKEAYLSDLLGNKIIDFKTSPLHLWAHSTSFKGNISKVDLEEHLFYSKDNPKWIPYHYRNEYNMKTTEWGFSLSYDDYQKLTDSEYYVSIDTTLDNSIDMNYCDYFIEGDSKETILFAAHTCHPALVTDGLSCVAVLLELIKSIKKLGKTKYSYRLVFGAEYYAGAAYLSQANQSDIDSIIGGVFLDMLGNGKDICWQTSFQSNSFIDNIIENIMKSTYKEKNQDKLKYEYRQLWGNDEMFYNGPGYFIPTAGIGGDKFNEYHYSVDDNDFVNYDELLESISLMEKLVDIVEKNAVPQLNYKGPLYLSKYNIYIDFKKDPEGYKNIEYIQILADGKNSILDISTKLSIDFFFVYEFFEELRKKDLATYVN